LFGLSKLSVWWLRLGINIERNKPGHPGQNGRHERMHLTLKNVTTRPASFNFLQQEERFDRFMGVYNNERPHQALNSVYPGDGVIPTNDVASIVRCEEHDRFHPESGCRPASQISINDGFIRLETTDGDAPIGADCSLDTHNGRMVVDDVNDLLYVCTASGWKTSPLD
jgi:hypothetical protein